MFTVHCDTVAPVQEFIKHCHQPRPNGLGLQSLETKVFCWGVEVAAFYKTYNPGCKPCGLLKMRLWLGKTLKREKEEETNGRFSFSKIRYPETSTCDILKQNKNSKSKIFCFPSPQLAWAEKGKACENQNVRP